MKIIESKACGKIYIAGEYAVVLNKPAIIAPINKYLSIKIQASDNYYLRSHKYHQDFIKLNIESQNLDTIYVCRTIKWFKQYLSELGIKTQFIKIEIMSELDSEDNKKYGFGSSGAITIALLKGLFIFYELEYNELILYKAGVMIQSTISKNSSYGDLACITFEKLIYYQKFDIILLEIISNLTIKEALNIEWSGLIIQELDFNFHFLIVHAKQQANSLDLVSKMYNIKNEKLFIDFLNESEELVNTIIKKPFEISVIISKLYDNLKILNSLLDNIVITKEMDQIEEIVNLFNGSMKFSGAGGGDVVICFFDNQIDLLSAKHLLTKNNFNSIIYPIKEDNHESKR